MGTNYRCGGVNMSVAAKYMELVKLRPTLSYMSLAMAKVSVRSMASLCKHSCTHTHP